MTNPLDFDDFYDIINSIYNTIISNPNTIGIFFSFEFFHTVWTGIFS